MLVAVAAIFALVLATAPAQAATPDDIYVSAMQGYQDGKNVNELVAEAFATAKAEGIPYYQVMAGLSETLVEMGVRAGTDPLAAVDEVSAAIINKICEYGLNRAETMRAISQMILGIRAASLRHGLDQEVVKSRIDSALNGAACSLQFAEAVIDPSFQEAVLATYTAPDMFFGTQAPPGAPTVNSYDPRMDHTIIPVGDPEPVTPTVPDDDPNPSDAIG